MKIFFVISVSIIIALDLGVNKSVQGSIFIFSVVMKEKPDFLVKYLESSIHSPHIYSL